MGKGKILDTWMGYPSVSRMVERITGRRRMGSVNTANAYVWGLYYFCKFLGYEDPESLLSDAVPGKVDVVRKVDEFIDYKMNHDVAAKTLSAWLPGVRKWCETNDVVVDWGKVEMPRQETVEEDRAPTRGELAEIANHLSLRDKAIMLCLVSSGLRIGTLLSLKMGDIDFETYPDVVTVTVRRAMGRKFVGNGKFFVTFLSPEAKKVLQQYLAFRERRGKTKPSENSYLFSSRQNVRTYVTTFQTVWARALQKAGLDQKKRKIHELHVHTLRKFFRTQCEAAGVKRSFWDFWMGHKGGYLDESYFRAVEIEHVAEYRKAIPYLTATETPAISREEVRTEVISALMGKIGDAELAPIASKLGISPQQIRSMIRKIGVKGSEEETEALLETERTTRNGGNNNNHESKLITEEELCSHIDEGWDMVKELSSGKILIRRPS